MQPIGSNTTQTSAMRLSVVKNFKDLEGYILSVLHPAGGETDDTGLVPSDLLNSNVAGFLYVRPGGVDLDKGTFLVLSPCSTSLKALPSKYMLVGDVKWSE
jgi:hypothetical protein